MITIQKDISIPADGIRTFHIEDTQDGATIYRMILPYPCPVIAVGERITPWEIVEAIDYTPAGVEVIVRDMAPPDPELF